jgi:hypothetical protein
MPAPAWLFHRVLTNDLLNLAFEDNTAPSQIEVVLGEKFWPTARPQVKKARRRI